MPEIYSQVPEKTKKAPSLHSVLIATDNREAAQSVSLYLEDIGYTVEIAFYDGKKLNAQKNISPNAILCYFSEDISDLSLICEALRVHYKKLNPPIIGAIGDEDAVQTDLFDSVIFPPAHHSQIATRVNSMVRLQEMENEIAARVATLSESFAVQTTLKDNMIETGYRILFIGQASPDFMVIINALQKKNVEVVAAFTSFSAFDYLHEETFDAVVMNALEGPEPAMTISETMRKNSRLYHVPTLFLVNEDNFVDHATAFERGARDIISAKSPEPEISARILELANYHRIHNQLKNEFGSLGGENCLDSESKVFNQAFFEAHMKRTCETNIARGTNLSIIALKLKSNAGPDVVKAREDRAYAQVGSMLKNLVRMHDVVARLDFDTYMVAFSGLPKSMTYSIQSRIMSIVQCAAFESGNANKVAFTINMDCNIVEFNPEETSGNFINRAYNGFNTRAFPIDKSA